MAGPVFGEQVKTTLYGTAMVTGEVPINFVFTATHGFPGNTYRPQLSNGYDSCTQRAWFV